MRPAVVVQALPFSQSTNLCCARAHGLRRDLFLQDLMHLLMLIIVQPALPVDELDADAQPMPP
jgi:hypothetical protein